MQCALIHKGCTKVQDARQAQGRQRSVIQIGGAKVLDGRQAQGRQRSVIQIRGQRYRTAGRLRAGRKGKTRENYRT